MGDLVPLADYARGARVQGAPTDEESPWFQPAPDPGDWDPCGDCPVRGACREVRECHWGQTFGDDSEPDIALRLVEPPDIVA
jgi:hypothetical protein